MNNLDIVKQFRDNAEKATVGIYQVKNRIELWDTISQLVPRNVPIFCPRVTNLEKAAALSISHLARSYTMAQVTIEEVPAAVAETGSIVCTSTDGKAVQASLLPFHHVALVRKEKIYPSLDDLFASYAPSPPTNITVITGPSRTADIELNLVTGVHGPGRLDVIVIE